MTQTVIHNHLFVSPSVQRRRSRFGLVLLVLAGASAAVWFGLYRDTVLGKLVTLQQLIPGNSTTAAVVAGDYAGYQVDADQATVAADIIAAGQQVGASERDIKTALMTALAESDLGANLCCDLDSQNAFQQRPSQDWPDTLATKEAAIAFFEGHGTNAGLLDIEGREWKDAGSLAQEVQRSAHPERYGEFKAIAAEIVKRSKTLPTTDELPPVSPTGIGAFTFGESEAFIAAAFNTSQQRVFPLAGRTLADMTSEYGWRNGGGKRTADERNFHSGTDLACDIGEPLLAVESGTMQHINSDPDGYGPYTFAIRADDGTEYLYGHGQKRLVAAGDRVIAGQPVGECASLGNSSGPHLHFEVMPSGSTQPIDPRPYLQAIQ